MFSLWECALCRGVRGPRRRTMAAFYRAQCRALFTVRRKVTAAVLWSAHRQCSAVESRESHSEVCWSQFFGFFLFLKCLLFGKENDFYKTHVRKWTSGSNIFRIKNRKEFWGKHRTALRYRIGARQVFWIIFSNFRSTRQHSNRCCGPIQAAGHLLIRRRLVQREGQWAGRQWAPTAATPTPKQPAKPSSQHISRPYCAHHRHHRAARLSYGGWRWEQHKFASAPVHDDHDGASGGWAGNFYLKRHE